MALPSSFSPSPHHSSPYLPYWLAASYLENVGPLTLFRWLKHFSDIKALFTSSDTEKKEKGLTDNQIKIIKNINQKQIETDLTWLQAAPNHHLLCFDDADYPELLKQIAAPPFVLFIKGNKAALSLKQIALVGSRHATEIGKKNAEHFSSALAQVGYVITSGLAMGIDGFSHQSALKAKAITIGVSGTGLNTTYPRCHHRLYHEILNQQGAIISEFPLNLGPMAFNFPRRNRIISGLSLGVLVVEAALKSGSLITARHALEQNREVFAIPGSIHNPLSRGCHYLIRQGAKLVETVDDILEELGGIKQSSKSFVCPTFATLSLQQTQVLDKIDYEITPLDVIIWRSRLTRSEVCSILLILELSDYVQSVPGGYIRWR